MGVMARVLVTTALVGAAGATAPAHAGDPPVGRPCTFSATSWEPVTGPDLWVAAVRGGPVVVAGSSVTLRCGIHVADARHSGPAAASVTSAPGPGVAAIAPQVVSYQDPYGRAVVCSQVVADATTWYSTGDEWTTDPTAWCPYPRELTEPPDLPPPLDWLEGYLWCVYSGEPCSIVEYLACDATRTLPDVPGVIDVREDGDIYVLDEWIWNCPPYGS